MHWYFIKYWLDLKSQIIKILDHIKIFQSMSIKPNHTKKNNNVLAVIF